MSHYGDYIKEKDGKNIIEDENGFATYQIIGEACYIENIYVIPDMRKSKVGSTYADEIISFAKEKGCKFLTGTVRPSANNSTESLQVLLAYGFKLIESQQDAIYFAKEI